MRSLLQICPDDDVAVALVGLGGQSVVDGWPVAADIPAGHKLAIRAVKAGDPVRKYGWPIGRALCDIAPGDHVHSHNLATGLSGVEDYRFLPSVAARRRGVAEFLALSTVFPQDLAANPTWRAAVEAACAAL